MSVVVWWCGVEWNGMVVGMKYDEEWQFCEKHYPHEAKAITGFKAKELSAYSFYSECKPALLLPQSSHPFSACSCSFALLLLLLLCCLQFLHLLLFVLAGEYY
jgi:hypothetical protein